MRYDSPALTGAFPGDPTPGAPCSWPAGTGPRTQPSGETQVGKTLSVGFGGDGTTSNSLWKKE